MIGNSGSLIWSKTLMELIFNPCGEFRWSPEGPVSQIHSPRLHAVAPGIFSDILKSVQKLKREWGAESNGELSDLFIPSKTATLVSEVAVKDLPLGRTAALVPGFVVKGLPFGRTYTHNKNKNFWPHRKPITGRCGDFTDDATVTDNNNTSVYKMTQLL